VLRLRCVVRTTNGGRGRGQPRDAGPCEGPTSNYRAEPGLVRLCAASREDRTQVSEHDPLMLDVFVTQATETRAVGGIEWRCAPARAPRRRLAGPTGAPPGRTPPLW